MNVISTNSANKNFTRASAVSIPDIYNRRFKTGKDDLDNMFGGQGFLPGFTFTLAAAPGTGKCHDGKEKIKIHGSVALISQIKRFIKQKNSYRQLPEPR